jgi:small subunit ribosomal protein S17
MPETTENGKSRRKRRQGKVVSDRMDRTVVVSVSRSTSHPLYGKPMVRQKNYHAHDEANEYRIGDLVVIEETRPLSKKKRWRVVELIDRPEAEG